MMRFNNLSKLVMAVAATFMLAACGGQSGVAGESGPITVISREAGSGTRDAFVEITGVMADKKDNTTPSASIVNSTDQVKTTVTGDDTAIGYISLGSLDDSVKALKINGVEASEPNVLSGKYTISRPFNIVYKNKDALSSVAKDFIRFIHSEEGQKVVSDANYVPLEAEAYTPEENLSGSIKIAGSTSVGPVMEKLAEAYKKVNPNVKIDITQNGSGAGITSAEEGTADIGMASRELKEDEKGKVESDTIAKDGIAIIVNKENKLSDLSVEQLKKIFTGEVEDWQDLNG